MTDTARSRPRSKAEHRGRTDWSSWPVYEAAGPGLRNFWYPVLWSNQVGGKPTAVKLLGEKIMLCRDGGKVYALHDRCPHRGVPLSYGTREFPGTVSCPYHGWTFDLGSGNLCAAITDGPDSPIAGKVTVRSYQVEERLGLVWVFAGDPGVTPPPIEDEIPSELLTHDVTIGGRIEAGRSGDWRYAAENGFDEGHAKYLHRFSLWAGYRQLPVWNRTRVLRTESGEWLYRKQEEVNWDADFPGLGHWTQRRWWRKSQTAAKPSDADNVDPTIASLDLPAKACVKLPYCLRIAYPQYIHYEWAVPEDEGHHRYVQLLVSFAQRPLDRLRFRLAYAAYIRWAFHGQFTGQDAWMVDVMDIPPERLYRPDTSVIEYRRMVEDQHRQDWGRRPGTEPAETDA
jgi:nitrite reductase/ring-hydroxylating ferredoxin subunit